MQRERGTMTQRLCLHVETLCFLLVVKTIQF